jgi:hypothetical protein
MITLAATAGALALLAAGCGGGGSPGAVGGASSTTTTTAANGTTTVPIGQLAGALAFARCMRAHGIPGWPDPTAGGVFDKSKLRQLGLSVSRVRAIEETSCRFDFEPAGPAQGQTITPADQADYLAGARCMRAHGVPDFPDPTFQHNTVTFETPPNVDPTSPQAKRAVAICVKLIPAGLPYSNGRAP